MIVAFLEKSWCRRKMARGSGLPFPKNRCLSREILVSPKNGKRLGTAVSEESLPFSRNLGVAEKWQEARDCRFRRIVAFLEKSWCRRKMARGSGLPFPKNRCLSREI